MNKEFKQKYLLKLIERHGSIPKLAKFSKIHRRTLENWKYGVNEMPDHTYDYLRMLENKSLIDNAIIDRLTILKDWIYTDNSICKEDKEYIDHELSYTLNTLKAHKTTE